MSDSSLKKDLSGVLGEILTKFEQTKLFTFSKPYIDFIGKGTMFSIVYVLMALISLIGLPVGSIIFAIQLGIFNMGAQGVIWFILTWFCVVFAGWVGFQLWWARKSQVGEVKESEFVATPIMADIFRTFGEWIGTILIIVGFGGGLFGLIVMSANGYLNAIPGGPALVLAGPIAGFFIILFFRLVAEGMKLFVSIANSCRDIAKK